MKKYYHYQKDCEKSQLEDEHIVIIQVDQLTLYQGIPSSSFKTGTTFEPLSSLTINFFPASTRVH